MNHNRRAVPYLVPLTLLALASGVTPVVSGVIGTLTSEGAASLGMLFSDRALLYSVKISTVWATATTLGVLLLAFPIAVNIHLRPRLFPLAMVVLAVPWVVPVFISAPVWRLFFHGLNGESLFSVITGIRVNLLTQPVGSFVVVLFTSVWRSLPPAVFILYAAVRKIPRSTVEAAAIDGAGQWETARFIFFPQAREFFLILVVVGLVEGFGEFTLPFLMTAGGPPLIAGITDSYVVGATTTIELYLYDLFQFSGDMTLPVVYATVTLLVFLVLAAAWFVVRRKGRATLFVVALAIAAMLVFDRSAAGIIMVGVLVLSLPLRSVRHWTVRLASAGYLLYTAVLTISTGVLEGFQPAALPLLFLVLQPHRPRIGRAPGGGRIHAYRRGLSWMGSTSWAGLRFTSWAVIVLSSGLFLYLLLWISVSGVNSVFVDSVLPPFLGLSNYAELLSDRAFYVALLNTALVAALTAAVTIAVTFPAAAAAAVLTNAGRTVFFGLQFLRLSGGIHSLIPLFAVFLVVRLVDTRVPLVLLYAFQAAPISFIVIHAFIRDLPRSPFDAARIAGATTGQYLRRILLPVCGPPTLGAGLIAFLTAWNGFLIPLVFLTDHSKFPISIYLHNAVGTIASGSPAWGLFAAGSVVNVVVLTGLFLLVRRPFLSTSAAHIE